MRPVRPTVTITPADGATGVSVDTTIVLAFSVAMDPATLAGGHYCLSDRIGCIAGQVAWPNDTTMIFTPDAPLGFTGSHYPTLTGSVTSADGIYFQGSGGLDCDAPDLCTIFSTEALPSPPTAIITPADGSGGVALDAVVQLEFSAPMNQASVEGGGFCLSAATGCTPGGYNWSGLQSVTFTPTSPLQSDGVSTTRRSTRPAVG